MSDILELDIFDDVFFDEKDKKSKKEKKKTKKKKKNKKEKNIKEDNKEKITSQIKELSIPQNNNGSIFVEITLNKCKIKNINGVIYLFDKNKGYYKIIDEAAFGTIVFELLKKKLDDTNKLKSSDIKEGFRLLKMNADIQIEKLSNMRNQPYICCENGVLRIDENITVEKYSPKYEFTRRINAKYNPNADGKKFNEYLNYVTCKNKALKHLLQEIFGYIISNYDNLRLAFMIIGVKGSGKSLFLYILRNILGIDNTSSVNMQDFEKEYYRAELLNKDVNIVPDLPETPIKDEISTFKSITSSLDTLTGRMPYGQPQNQECHSKMIFACNHPPQLKGISQESIEAFFDRMIFIPFNRRVSDDMRNPNLSDDLMNEKDFIFTWACKGLQRLINNNFKFTECKDVSECKEKYWVKQCPEQSFVKYHLSFADTEIYESSKKIKKAFEEYCSQNGVSATPSNICRYLEYSYGISKHGSKKRIDDKGKISSDGNPISVYRGVRLI